MELVRDVERAVNVLREHRSSETVMCVVRLRDDLLLVRELDDDADGAEDLLLHDLHGGLGVGEDGRGDEVALRAVLRTAEVHRRAVLLAGFDVAHDTLYIMLNFTEMMDSTETHVELGLADLRALVGLRSERVAELESLRLLGEALEELVVDFLMYENTGACAARLAVVPARYQDIISQLHITPRQ